MHIALVGRGEIGYTLDLAIQLYDAGCKVSVYLWDEGFLRLVGDCNHPVERLYEVGVLPRECQLRLFGHPRMRDPRSFSFFRKLSEIIREDGADVVHLLVGSDEFWLGVLALLLRDVPVTITMTQPTRDIGERVPFPVIWTIQKLLTYTSDSIIVNGIEQVELVRKLYGVPNSRVNFIPLSVSTSAVRYAEKTVPETPGTVLFFGRAAPHKGLDYLVKAQPLITRKVPHARILIASHGKDLTRCKKMIYDQKYFEIHEGFSTGEKMATLFQRSSIVALPYLCSTSSGVLMVAHAFAKPVVATNVAGLYEYIEEGITGLMVAPANVEQLAKGIIRLLLDDSLRLKMGESSKRWVEEWQKNVIMDTLKVYEKAILDHSKFFRSTSRKFCKKNNIYKLN